MAIAEIFIGAFITVLFEKLASSDLIRLAQSAGIDGELNKWSNTLSQIQAVLLDAGQKHITQTTVQHWLHRLQHLAYEIDDVLDELITESTQLKRASNSSNSTGSSKALRMMIPYSCTSFTPESLKYGRKMSSKLDEITTKLNALVLEKKFLGLIDNVERSSRGSRRLEETSLVDLSRIVGRDGDKKALLRKLLCNESVESVESDDENVENVSIVSIVGLGGIGKTTLAQVLYNDKNVKDHFKLMSWVCVSDEFDVFKISKAVFKDVGGEDMKFETLNQLQVAIAEKLSNKRFLFVLDDVWDENYNEWELLQRPFAAGARGSKIIVTTRKNTVASMMDSAQAYPLDFLSNEKAVSLFAQHALGKHNFDSHPTLRSHGEGIVKKCGGLPLALITLGRVLRTKSDDEDWEKLLNSEIWNLHNESNILPALRLSYYDLPPHLKQMFAYCCLFPKDYVFEKDELVLLWMAEGFLRESSGSSKSMETLGRECFEELESRSFFQHSTNNKSGYTMHELINDLATSVATEFFYMWGDKMDLHDMKEALEKFHHLSFIRQQYGVYRKFKALHRSRRLRTFLAVSATKSATEQRFYISNQVLTELLPKLHFLRVLSLANYNITVVPNSIGSLKHMRYLNFSNTDITCLPEQIGDLYNLQSLLVSGCPHLFRLPNSITKLTNLRHLDISDTPMLVKIPKGIVGLTGLRILSKVIIGGANEFKISDLKDLMHLQGQLSIEGLHKVMNATQAKEACLQQKKGLRDLEMKWSDVFNDSRSDITEYEVFEGLKPSEKLTSLKVFHYKGTKFPSWVGDASLVCLTQLTLHGCSRCTRLPTLGHLPSLQKLFVQSMNAVKRVDSGLLRPPNFCHSVAFPSLEVLEFKDMESWQEWSTDKDESIGWFPHLLEVSLINCPKLDVVAIELIPSLQVLHIQGCSAGLLKSMVDVAPSIIRLMVWDSKGLSQLHRESLERLRTVENLRIFHCDELSYLWKSEAEACKILVSLQKLEVNGCVNLISLGEEEVTPEIGMESSREVEITGCPRLESYYCPNSIEKLKISRCSLVTSLTFQITHDVPSTLKILQIEDCDNLEVNWLHDNFLSSLESLVIYKTPNLRLFHDECLVHLTTLVISSCDNIETIPGKGLGFLPFLCLRSLVINNCKNLNSFPYEHLPSLTSLVEMRISNCPRMDRAFPNGLWPPNLSTLFIGGLKKPVSEWGQQNFPTSLVTLILYGKNSGLVSFAKVEDTRNNNNTSSCSSSFFLPSSLTYLYIRGFMELESLSKGLQHLNCLEELVIVSCPKLRDLPVTLLPSLSRLSVDSSSSQELRKKCDRRTGKYRHVISQIPDLHLY